MKKKGAKKRRSYSRSRGSSNDLLNKRNIIILIVILTVAYFLFNYSGDDTVNEEGELGSLRLTLKNWILRIFGGGKECGQNSDCPNGEFCDTLVGICGDVDPGTIDLSDATHD